MPNKFLILAALFLLLPPVFGYSADFLDGGSVTISNTAETEIGRVATNLPAGDNIIIATFSLNGGTAAAIDINPGNLRIKRGQTTILTNNLYAIGASGTTAGKERNFIALIANDTNAPANAVYNFTALATAAGASGAVKMIVIGGASSAYQNGTGGISIAASQTRLLSQNTTMPAGDKIVIATIQLDNTQTAVRNIVPGNLNIKRQGVTIANNTNLISLERSANPINDMGILLIGNDTNAPANAQYNISAQASNTGVNARSQIIVIDAMKFSAYDSPNVTIGTTETQVGLLNTTYYNGGTAVLASVEFRNYAAATRTIAAGNERMKNFTTNTASSNTYAFTLGAIGNGFDYRSTALMWYDENSTVNAQYNISALASAAGISGEAEIIAIRISSPLKANGSVTGPTKVITGRGTNYTASCEALDYSASNVNIVLQNSTDNITFTTIGVQNSGDIYANASSYTISSLAGNSTSFTFKVNATKARENYTLRTQCSAAGVSPLETNTTGSNVSVTQAFGYINVTLFFPSPSLLTNVIQNRTFLLYANVTCLSDNPTAACDEVNGTAVYNQSTAEPLAQVNTTSGDKPFWSAGNETCGQLNFSNVCNLVWTVNATGAIGKQYKIGARFTSNSSSVVQNTTSNATLAIIGCGVDFTLHWTYIDFGTLVPSTAGNPAPGNQNNVYNISVNSDSCNLDLYINGTGLNNTALKSRIEIGNMTWSNVSNSGFSSSWNITSTAVAIRKNAPWNTNVTTWYWFNMPPVFAGFYDGGNITITGVYSGTVI